MNKDQSHKFCVAPMMDWTDRHCRVFHRMLTKHALLYTEMVTADAVIHGDRQKLLGFSQIEHPVALQLGGSEVKSLAQAAKIGEEFGYDEVNLNIGCPSDRVQQGRFGACLMAEPDLVAECVSEMISAVKIPITVKCRIGIDDQDSEHDLKNFVEKVKNAGCNIFIIHARKAWLEGLSPKQNRDVPPLDYGRVYRLKADYPDLTVIINGGIQTIEQAKSHMSHVDGVMLGRSAYQTPYILSEVDQVFFENSEPKVTAKDAVTSFMPYVEQQISKGVRLHQMTRHILGVFQGVRGARAWRRVLSEMGVQPEAGADVLKEALGQIKEHNQAA